jgi:hypothetical protein
VGLAGRPQPAHTLSGKFASGRAVDLRNHPIAEMPGLQRLAFCCREIEMQLRRAVTLPATGPAPSS